MNFKNWFWGLAFIIAAIAIIASQLGCLSGINIFTLAISFMLLFIIIKSCTKLNFFGILFPIAILCILYASPLGITNLVPWPVLITALFGSIGLSLIFHDNKWHNYFSHHQHNHFDQIVDDPDDDVVEYHVSFGAGIKYVNTENFKKGVFSCSFGALELYLDNVKLNEDGATIHLDASFSGIELYIPKTWNIVNKLSTTLGGVDDKRRGIKPEGPVVTLVGNVSFSGVEIIYV